MDVFPKRYLTASQASSRLAIEDFGSLGILCSDNTGTLTGPASEPP
jgi:magnesium-transporting ATPase (P-type)